MEQVFEDYIQHAIDYDQAPVTKRKDGDTALLLYYRTNLSQLIHINKKDLHSKNINDLRNLIKKIQKILKKYGITTNIIYEEKKALQEIEWLARLQPDKVKKKKTPKRTCKEYTVKELKKMAQDKQIRGYSTMKKDQLCKVLKIKK